MKIRVVLVEPEGEVNVGAVIRLAANFAIDEVVLVNPKVRISDETLRYAARAANIIAGKLRVCRALDEAIRDVEVSACTTAVIGDERDVIRHPLSLREFAERIVGRISSLAVVFGRESVGLTRRELEKCDLVVTIPANPEYPVLNLSQAVAITLYELYVTTKSSRLHRELKYADVSDLDLIDRICRELGRILQLPEEKESSICTSLKHVLYKALPTKAEARNILYLLSKVRSKLAR